MTEPKHTPGPWVVSHETDGMWIDAARLPVCRIRAAGIPSPEEIADANLIAAAPDMLEHLRAAGCNLITAAHTIERLGGKEEADAVRRMAKQILPIIAKATGAA